MRQEHLPERPKWQCMECAVDWPCEPVRPMLVSAHSGSRVAVQHHMAWLLVTAAGELSVAGPAKLFGRFLAWTLDEGQVCRVCGKAGHDFLPGVPPRLMPCDGYAIEPVRRARGGEAAHAGQ
ncbi:MAG: hypothetical protein V7603_2877 [Micromonosporaceae bacterium]